MAMSRKLLCPALLLALAAPALAAAPEAGTARNCLALSNIRQSIVRNDRTIDFVMRDGSVFRNTLPYRCAALGFERAFSYQTSISQLCRQDLISVIQQTGGTMLASRCGLGDFVAQAPSRPPPPKN